MKRTIGDDADVCVIGSVRREVVVPPATLTVPIADKHPSFLVPAIEVKLLM